MIAQHSPSSVDGHPETATGTVATLTPYAHRHYRHVRDHPLYVLMRRNPNQSP
ncbi:hypothetical protein M408DRAFT_333245 [Serendipita vermifera MAFF 305830]|uniref:Uncharacterized protein n=1 Tax=Serendipita vermifera MAFF 305830 TaxID=933852 RepID=A0A0C2WWR6_SERVB|nr:hypothetical protein M408DRAFT_333245 [Serendipita vermifera MAFF 305830]